MDERDSEQCQKAEAGFEMKLVEVERKVDLGRKDYLNIRCSQTRMEEMITIMENKVVKCD